MIHQLTIPDGLIEWGKQPELAVEFHRPWAHEVEEIAAEGADNPLKGRSVERLLARLEALCHEAIRRDRGDLLLGLDMLTAEWLGLVFSWVTPDGKSMAIGRSQRWDYQEVRAVLKCFSGRESRDFCEDVKSLVAEAFPRARIGAIIDAQEAEPDCCTGCGAADCTVMYTFDSGNAYCGKCYHGLTTKQPPIEKKPKKKRGKR